jgi:putative toxin-antitoxin system antitoxin component (TIGR02293 family)
MKSLTVENEKIRKKIFGTLGITSQRSVLAKLKASKQIKTSSKALLEFDYLVREGFSSNMLDHAKKVLKVADVDFALALGVHQRTLQRNRKQNKRLSTTESDRLYRIVRIFAIASQVLEDDKLASNWLNSEQLGLGGRIPLEMLQTEAGAREVEDLLGRIEYGVLV